MIIVGKSLPSRDPNSDEDEAQLPNFREILGRKGCFAYAWTFNPKQWAVEVLRQELDRRQHIWLYLIHKDSPWYSRLKMRIIDFCHSPELFPCPPEWRQYVPEYPPDESYIDGQFRDWGKTIRLWFLINQIQDLDPPENLQGLTPVFARRSEPPRYCEYKQNCFAFLQSGEDC